MCGIVSIVFIYAGSHVQLVERSLNLLRWRTMEYMQRRQQHRCTHINYTRAIWEVDGRKSSAVCPGMFVRNLEPSRFYTRIHAYRKAHAHGWQIHVGTQHECCWEVECRVGRGLVKVYVCYVKVRCCDGVEGNIVSLVGGVWWALSYSKG